MVRFGTGELSRVAGVEEARFLRGFRRAFNESHPDPAFVELPMHFLPAMSKNRKYTEGGSKVLGQQPFVRPFVMGPDAEEGTQPA